MICSARKWRANRPGLPGLVITRISDKMEAAGWTRPLSLFLCRRRDTGVQTAAIVGLAAELSSEGRAMDRPVSGFVRTVGSIGTLVVLGMAVMGNPYGLSQWTLWSLGAFAFCAVLLTVLVRVGT